MLCMSLDLVPAGLCGGDGGIWKPLRALLDQAFDGDKVLAIGTGISAHASKLGSNLGNQEFSLLSFSNRESSLENIIGELILHHSYNRTDAVLFGRHDLFDQQASTLGVGGDESLLANIRSKFVAGHIQHLATKLGNHKSAIVDSPMLEDELNDIIPKLVLHEISSVLVKLI